MGWGEPHQPNGDAGFPAPTRPRPIEVAAYDHLEKVTAERDRYRAALEAICDPRQVPADHNRMAEVALRALKPDACERCWREHDGECQPWKGGAA